MRHAQTSSPADDPGVMRGLAVQPFVTALLGSGVFLLDHERLASSSERLADPIEAATAFGGLVGIFGLLVTAFGAYPALRWLVKRGPVTRRHALISGALLGNVPAALIVGLIAISSARQGTMTGFFDFVYGPAGLLRLIVFGSFIGAASAAMFWWFARKTIGKRT